MSCLLDTNHCIYLLNGLDKKDAVRIDAEKNVIQKVRFLDEKIFMSEATIGELIFGAYLSSRKEYNLKRIDLLKKIIFPIPLDEGVWTLFGKTKASFKAKGKTLTDIDLLIGCTAIFHNLRLVPMTQTLTFGI